VLRRADKCQLNWVVPSPARRKMFESEMEDWRERVRIFEGGAAKDPSEAPSRFQRRIWELDRRDGAIPPEIRHPPTPPPPEHAEFDTGKAGGYHLNWTKSQFDAVFAAQRLSPVGIVRHGSKGYWLFQDQFWWEDEGLNADEVRTLIEARRMRERARIERARALVAQSLNPSESRRGGISDDVKTLVWKRDSGRCQSCGSTIELQFDHIIPVALGGSNEAENLQILCGPCNRRKGAGLSAQ
jgi:hypothetical protein